MNSEIKAENARQVLENPRFKQAFENVREGLVTQLESVPVGQAGGDFAKELVMSLQVLQTVKQDIVNDLNDLALDEAG